MVGSSTVPAGAADGDAEGDALPDGLAEGLADGAAKDSPRARPTGSRTAPRWCRRSPTARSMPRAIRMATGRQGQRRDRGRLRRLRLQADGEHGPDLDKPEPVETAVASRPCSAKTASTWSGVTFASWNLISQRVPPV